ncbi:MAG: hypothetical protein OXC00_16050, partial [Acidimicrobiaceae bacterium]|nr:hypothetical protein [Acidimicrobiaceae bacterium]
MRFGAWIPSFAYPQLDYDRARRGTDAFSKTANEHDIDLWVIDHLLHAPGLYGMAWLEPTTPGDPPPPGRADGALASTATHVMAVPA